MGQPKALLPFRNETFLDHLIGILRIFCEPVIVVLGHEAERIQKGMEQKEVTVVVNSNYGNGQLSSMQCGLRAVPEGAPGVLFTLVDHPDPAPETVARLFSNALISVPVSGGRRGHPVFFGKALIPEFLELPPEATAKEVFRRHSSETRYVEVEDPGILDDVDDPEAFQRFSQRTGVSPA